jgi:D-3-phosphoglycerate dehydrogenase / 2-oxoglutarate reductase
LGASTEEAQTQVAAEGAGLLIDFLTKGAVRHAVNMVSLDPQKFASLRGELDLAHRLGQLLSQLERSPVKACRLLYRGEVAAKETRLLTATFAAGLLEQSMAGEVNMVNAELLLRERGIELVEESRADMGAFSSIILAELVTEGHTHRAAGTLLGHEMTRLVQLGDYRLEAYLDGILLVFTHRDVPGIIGRVGTIFGKHKVNIAQMSVGRAGDAPGGEAVGVLNLDNPPPQEAITEMLTGPDILSASVIRLPKAGQLPAWLGG